MEGTIQEDNVFKNAFPNLDFSRIEVINWYGTIKDRISLRIDWLETQALTEIFSFLLTNVNLPVPKQAQKMAVPNNSQTKEREC